MRARGQATVELALGSVVFVGVLLIGIHMAEYAQLSLKVQDAEAFAVWEATSHRAQAHLASGETNKLPFARTIDAANGVGAEAEARYEDFDGLSTSHNGNVIGRALTQGSKLSVTCEEAPDLGFRATASARSVLWDVGGVRCHAGAQVKAINVPREFLQKDTGGFFRERMVRSEPMPVCGMGLPVDGKCPGALSVLTNDWALVNDETVTCKNDCPASPYRQMIEKLYAQTGRGGPRGRVFATQFAGAPPVSAMDYFFSYAGIDAQPTSLVDSVPGEGAQRDFVTGGAGLGMVKATSRPKGFLGRLR